MGASPQINNGFRNYPGTVMGPCEKRQGHNPRGMLLGSLLKLRPLWDN